MRKAGTDVNYDELAAFLKRVTPAILEALDDIPGSDALDGYNPIATTELALQFKLLNKWSTVDECDSKVIHPTIITLCEIQYVFLQYYS